MEEAKLNELLARLPQKQREVARLKILESEDYGWTEIGFMGGEGNDEADLAGIHPGSGNVEFLP